MSGEHDPAALLAAYRERVGPDASASARAWSGLARRAAAGEIVALPPEAAPAASARVPANVAVWAAAAVMVAAAAYAIGAGTATPTRATLFEQAVQHVEPAAADDVMHAAVPEPTRAAVMPAPVRGTTGAPTTIASPVVAPAPRRMPAARRPAAAPAVEPTPEPSIDAHEIRALRSAQSLLARDPQAALAALQRHATDYPSSSLGEQRAIAIITALCGVGRVDASRDAAAAFAATHPRSPLLARVRNACPDSSQVQTDPRTSGME